ncbi:MAG: RNA-binding protein, partial [Candidatus Aenigmatarchaeota archaeon]
IIGRIEDIAFSHWIVNINSPYRGILPLNEAVTEFVDLTKTDITKYFDYDDIIFAEVTNVTKTKSVRLSMKNRKCRKLYGGRLIKVTPAKVPRIIGKSGSMVEMIKEKTNCQIVVGQNGIVWIKGDKEALAVDAIQRIEENSHISGLTDKIKQMLEAAEGDKND